MELNWNLCVICKKETNEPLRCPLLNPITGGDIIDAYRSFLSNVNRFRVINGLPTELKFRSEESVENFTSHCASWHRSRHVKFSNQKLAKKETTAEKKELTAPMSQLKCSPPPPKKKKKVKL